MLPELIYWGELKDNYFFLVGFGFISAVVGIFLAWLLFPSSKADIVAVAFAAMPLIFPLTSYFFDEEKNSGPHLDEIYVYFALFTGQVLGFYLAGLLVPEMFSFQLTQFGAQLAEFGITGYATSTSTFLGILLNNLGVFAFILFISFWVGSSGAIVLAWNGSVLGVFLAILTQELPGGATLAGTQNIPSPIGYIPHATFEMAGFVVAGITGTMISAAIYRMHFEWQSWKKLGWMLATGVTLVFTGAFLEAGFFLLFLVSLIATAFSAHRVR